MTSALQYSRIFLVAVSIPLLSAASQPSRMWFATYSIENYVGNGDCGRGNLHFTHESAGGFADAIRDRNIPGTFYPYCRRDAQCYASRWTGTVAEINFVDFVYFDGHGCGTGPFFGCNPGYPIVCWDDIRFGGTLKWVQTPSCGWFIPPEYDDVCQSNRSVFDRWNPCFRGVHTVQGHQAITWEHPYPVQMAEEFWVQWYDWGYPIWWAWRQGQVIWGYERPGYPGLAPATAAANDSYGQEYYWMAQSGPAPNGMRWLAYTIVGTPQY